MVRKKLKKPHGAVSHGHSNPTIDPAEVVISWLRDLQLLENNSIPAMGLNMSHFDMLRLSYRPPLSSPIALAQVDDIRTLRKAVLAGEKIEEAQLRMLVLASMLLYIDPMAYVLRKSLGDLLLAIHETNPLQGGRTDDIGEIVVTKFIDLAWRIGERCKATCSRESMVDAMRLARSLQWLVDVPGAGRAFVDSDSGLQLGRSVACLGLIMEAQAAVLQGRPDDDIQDRSYAEAVTSKTPDVTAVMEHGKVNAVGVPLNKRVSVDVQFYCEILKATSSLLSFSRCFDTDKLPGGDAAVRRMCEICLILLSNATVHRETITHASAVLIHLTIAYWRAHGRWPGDTAVPSVVGIENTMDKECSQQLKVAPSMIVESFFADHGSGQSADMMGELVVAFIPLPPSSTLAVCRTLMHIASPHILLATYESSCGTLDNLFTGPIVHAILRNGDADRGLQLRFFALQVLETWCSKAEAFAESGVIVEDPAGRYYEERHYEEQPNLRHALSKITDVAVAALMHPSRFISSMAPSLLEHTVNLRHRICTNRGDADEQDTWDWGSLMEQVLEQPASNKGKYMALGVLLPQIGALQSITLCPSLVKQLVCAVGVRGNVSGQATSLLLQLLDSLKQEIQAKTDKADMLELEVMHACRGYWVGPAATALIQVDAWSRNHVADYLLPEMFKFDPGSAATLCCELRSRGYREATLLRTASPCLLPADTNGSAEPEVRQMWAMMEIARLGRKSGLMPDLTMIGGHGNAEAGDASSGLLQLHEVEWAALHADEDLRISALSVLCTDARVTTVPVAAETELLRKVLPYSLKIFSAQNRQNLLRAMQTLLIRIREAVRVCSKHLTKGCQASDFAEDKGQGKSDKLKGHRKHIHEASEERPRAGPMESPDGTVKRVKDLLRFLCQAILQSLYPGCPFEREVLGLEIVQLVLSELQPSKEAHSGKPGSNSLSQVVASSFFCRRWVDTLLNLLGSSWERTRCLSYAILSRFPRPLPGYDPLNGATRLASEGLRLAGSGRQRESDRGALILRLVFGAYARDLDLIVPLVALEAGQWNREESSGISGARVTQSAKQGGGGVDRDATVRFLVELCAIMSLRLDGMERSFNVFYRRQTGAEVGNTPPEKEMASSLPHGLFLAAHHVLVDGSRVGDGSRAEGRKQRRHSKPRTSDPTGDVVDLTSRREAMGILLECTFRALRLSQLIVGDDGEVNDGSGHMREDRSTDSIRDSGGRGAKMGTVTASVNHSVNANGHVGMVSVDCFGRSVPPPVHRGDDEAEKTNDAEAGCDVQNADAVEGQRAVVAAWLLAKEACRCLATMVTTSPLPLEDNETNKGDTCGEGSKALLTVDNVTAIGETLLRSMLSFKHMGCIVSAQNAFQTVCESLLHSSEHDSILSSLPSVWLEKLLRELDGAGQEFVLKRSAGLALAFMSLFRAEPRSVAPVLLPRGMSVLLALAETSQKIEDLPFGTEIDDETRWKSTVTALNVLRQAFVDAPLADDIGPYVTQATKAAVRGFEHPTWAVRNSSMMLFASIMQRAVGGAKNVENLHALRARRPHSAKAAVTAEDFFEQHKQLHPFLLSQLETAADEMSQVHSNSTSGPREVTSGRRRAEMHPALYPILLLLARLRSRGAEATVMQMEVEEQVDVDPRANHHKLTAVFVPAVIRCGRNPHFLARATSARALAALVPPPESFRLVHDLMRSLPKSAEDLAQGPGTYNFVHGTLLQVQELLLVARAVRDSGRMLVSSAMSDHKDKKDGDFGVSDELSEDTVNTILDRVWLADPQVLRCPPVRHAMLLVLRALEQSREHLRDGVNDRVLSTLRSTEELNLTDVIRAEHAGRFVPGNPLLGSAVVDATIRRRLEITFRTVSTDVDKDKRKGAAEIEFVVGLLCSSDVNVRDAAIKSSKKFFGDSEDVRMFTAEDQDALQQLWAGVAKALAVEAHHPNVRRLVRLLCRIGLKLDADRQLVSPEPLWCLLRKLCYDVRAGADVSTDVRAGALEAMGHLVRLGERAAQGSSYSSKLEEYVSLLESAVAPEEPMLTAAAAAKSLAVSGVLSCFIESPGEVGHRWIGSDEGLATIYVRLLFVMLVLLQDDDQRVRASVAYTWAKATSRPSFGRDSEEGVVAPSKGRGARVDICATENILARLAALSESVGDKGSVAEQFTSDLMRAIEEISHVDVGGLLMALSVAGEGGPDIDECDNVWEHEGGGLIFDKEYKKRFHEPVPFARIAGPYLKMALIAIRTRGGVVPQSVTLALARVLNGLSEALEALAGSPRAAPRVTWLPSVYQGIVASAATGAAAVGHVFAGGAVLCSDEIARAVEACKKFNEALGRDAGLHPEVLSAVERVLTNEV